MSLVLFEKLFGWIIGAIVAYAWCWLFKKAYLDKWEKEERT